MCHVNTSLVMSVLRYEPGARGGRVGPWIYQEGSQAPSQVTTVHKLFVLKSFLILN